MMGPLDRLIFTPRIRTWLRLASCLLSTDHSGCDCNGDQLGRSVEEAASVWLQIFFAYLLKKAVLPTPFAPPMLLLLAARCPCQGLDPSDLGAAAFRVMSIPKRTMYLYKLQFALYSSLLCLQASQCFC